MAGEYIKLFVDCIDTWGPLGDAERGRLVMALLEYKKTGIVPNLNGAERYVFPTHKAQIDRDTGSYVNRCESNALNGKKGGRPRKEKSEKNPKNPIGFLKSEKSQEEDKDKDKDKDKERSPNGDQKKSAVAAVMSAYLDKINPTPSASSIDELKGYVESMGAECCLRAMDIALDEKKTSWAYIRGILRSKLSQGVKCLADWDKVEAERAGTYESKPDHGQTESYADIAKRLRREGKV